MNHDADELFKILNGMHDYDEESRETYIRAPFAWPGGKDASKDKILKALPYRDSFIETCGGSGIIFLNRRASKLDVFNDRCAGVTAFYRCLRDKEKMKQMMEWLSLTIHSREEFVWCKSTWRTCHDDVERACRWYYMVRMSFGSQRRNFGRSVKGKAQQPNLIYSSLSLFHDIHHRMADAQIENLDLFDCIRDYQNEGAVFYIDPNYVGVSKGIYEDEIDDCEQHRLCETIMRSRGFFALSGYENPIYDSKDFTWDQRLTWEVAVNLQAQAFTATNNKKDQQLNLTRFKAQEVLWIKDNS